MKGTLNLGDNIYKVKSDNTKLYLFQSHTCEGTLTIGVDISFQDGKYDNIDVSPFICINEHETNVKDLNQLVGMTFEVKSVDEADEREDTFYLFEHEPLQNYQMTVIEIKGSEIHLEIKGIAITDGYAEPYKSENFLVDCWLPVPKV